MLEREISFVEAGTLQLVFGLVEDTSDFCGDSTEAGVL